MIVGHDQHDERQSGAGEGGAGGSAAARPAGAANWEVVDAVADGKRPAHLTDDSFLRLLAKLAVRHITTNSGDGRAS